MEQKWKKYYNEIFRTYTSEFFIKLWGDYLDEYGDEYEDVYKWELKGMKSEFIEFMYLFNKYDLEYDKNAIALKIIDLFETLGDCDCVEGAYKMADMLLYSIEKRIGFNDAWHPEGKPIK